MKERPILFSGSMISALLAGRKTQTRRLVNHNEVICRYGVPGDVLWVREAFWNHNGTLNAPGSRDRSLIEYRATPWERECDEDPVGSECGGWKPSIHMPRWACRLRLRITDARCEHLQDISKKDALAEGIRPWTKDGALLKYWPVDAAELPSFRDPLYIAWKDMPKCPVEAFRGLWEVIHGKGSWDANPWLWCLTVERIDE